MAGAARAAFAGCGGAPLALGGRVWHGRAVCVRVARGVGVARRRAAVACAQGPGKGGGAGGGEEERPVVDASGAFQVDDGSQSERGSFVAPTKLKRKKKARKGPAPLAFLVNRLDSHKSLVDTLVLGGMFATWYWANTMFNVFNKQVLKVFPFPITCTMLQFAVAAACMASLWLFRVKPAPRLNRLMLRSTLPLAVLHAAGFLLTNMSLGKVSVAFTHTVKATEPFFSVALTPSILGEVPTWGIVMSLCPIVAGVVLASATEASFNWVGFLSAVGSNLALQSRNVLSKKLMVTASSGASPRQDAATIASPPVTSLRAANADGMSMQSLLPFPVPRRWRARRRAAGAPRAGETHDDMVADTFRRLDNVNLFSTMSIFAFVLLLPLSLALEGMPLATAAASAAVTGMSGAMLARKLVLGGVCRCLDVLASYMILQRVSPITHSVGNCVKRAIVIVISIFVFKTSMSLLNVLGTALALAGVCVYSLVVSACKQNTFGPDSYFCKPIYEMEVELTEGGGI